MKKRIISAILAAVIMFTMIPYVALPANANQTAGVLTYTINGGNATITRAETSATNEEVQAAFDEIAAAGYTITAIGNGAFQNVSGLTEIELHEGLTTIQSNAFSRSSLVSITIPATVTNMTSNIQDSPFTNMTTLTTVTFADGMTSIPQRALAGASSVTEIILPDTVTAISSDAFSRTGISTIELPPNLRTIGSSAFQNCANLTSIELPEGLTTIDNSTFQNCTNLTSITLPNSLRTIRSRAFQSCTNLTSIDLPEGLTAIGNSAFSGTALTLITIPQGLTTIEMYTFANTTSLESIFIPESVTNIALFTFGNNAPDFTIFGVTGSAAEDYANRNNIPFRTIENNITLWVDSTTNTRNISISGIAPAVSEVAIYEDGVLLTTVTSLANGTFRSNITLTDRFGTRTLTARTTNSMGAAISDSRQVRYEENAPALTGFIMHHDRQQVDLLTETPTAPIVIRPNQNFTFTVDVENPESIASMNIASNRNGVVHTIPAHFDSNRGQWIASGFFDPDNRGANGYVPSDMFVQIRPDYSGVTETLEDIIDGDLDLERLLEITEPPPIFAEFEYDIIEESDNRTEIRVSSPVSGESTTLTVTQSNVVRYRTLNELSAAGFTPVSRASIDNFVRVVTTGNSQTAEYIRILGIDPTGVIQVAESYEYIIDGLGLLETYLETQWQFTDSPFADLGGYVFALNTAVSAIDLFRGGGTPAEMAHLGITFGLGVLHYVYAPKLAIAVGFAVGGPLGVVAAIGVLAITDMMIDPLADWIAYDILGVQRLNRSAIIFDPAGYVYEAVPSNRLTGATVTALFRETPDCEPEIWDAVPFGQANPLITDWEGRYAWDVPQGYWQVRAEIDGFVTAYSEIMPVPPIQLNVNIGMINATAPTVELINAYPDFVEIAFSRYMDISTLTAENITIMLNGTAVSGTIEFVDKEHSIDPTTEYATYLDAYFASVIRFVPDTELNIGDNITVNISRNVRSYADTRMAQVFSRELTVVSEPQMQVAEDFRLNYDGSRDLVVNFTREQAGMTVTVVSDNPFIAEVVESSVTIGADGRAIIQLVGNLPGTAQITLTLDGTLLTRTIDIEVANTLAGDIVDDDSLCDCRNCADCGFHGGRFGFGRVTAGSDNPQPLPTVQDAIAILRSLVGLPSIVGDCEDATAAAIILPPDYEGERRTEPNVQDAIAILRFLVELPSSVLDSVYR